SLDELLGECDAELALLITNETRRIDPLRQLLAAGRHVFTEKPLCGMEGQHSVREEDAAIAWPAIREWRESGLKFGINYNYRYFTHFRKLHEDAVEGRLGEITMVRARAHFNCWSHVIDQILWTMGLPEWVSCLGDPSEAGGWQRMIHMRWANGVPGALDGANGWGYDDHPLRLMICGTESYAEARGLDGWYRRCKAGGFQTEVEDEWDVGDGPQEYGESFGRMADAVIEAMQADQPWPADGEDAWNELLFEAAVHRSALRDGERVSLADVAADAAKG
ncbi:MAG: hypothetical protein PVH68_11905, partial [Armatimonadota bacterium]